MPGELHGATLLMPVRSKPDRPPSMGAHVMPKVSFTTVLIVVICGVVGWLAFDPDAAREVSNWVHRQVGSGKDVPDPKSLSYPAYSPVIPGK